jgi:tetratricopeptide (TPR) repeat protein
VKRQKVLVGGLMVLTVLVAVGAIGIVLFAPKKANAPPISKQVEDIRDSVPADITKAEAAEWLKQADDQLAALNKQADKATAVYQTQELQIQYLKAEIYIRSQQNNKAIDVLNAALKNHPDPIDQFDICGRLYDRYVDLNDKDHQIEALTKLLAAYTKIKDPTGTRRRDKEYYETCLKLLKGEIIEAELSDD